MKRSLLLLFICAIVLSCNNLTDHPIPPDTARLTISKQEAFPLEALTFTLSENADKPSVKGKIGLVNFDAKLIAPGTYALLVPSTIGEGTYDFSIADVKDAISIKIKTAKSISNSSSYTQTYFDEVKKIIDTRLKEMQDSLVARNISSQQAMMQEQELLVANMKLASDKFNALSDEDKKKCVAFIEANKENFDAAGASISNVNFQITTNPNGRILAVCNESSEVGNIKCQITNFTTGTSQILSNILSFSALEKFETEPYVLTGMEILSDVIGLETLIEAKNVSKKLARLAYILTDPALDLTSVDAADDNFEFKNDVKKAFNVKINVRNIQEDLDIDSANPVDKEFANNLKNLVAVWDSQVGNSLADKPGFAPLRKEAISPETGQDISVEVVGNPNVKSDFTFTNGILNISYTTSETTDQTFDIKITYKYNGNDAVTTKTVTLAKPIVLGDTVWDFTIIYSSTLSWHANVTFKADGTTIYDEPDSPGVYTAYGDWTLTGDKIHWYLDKAREKAFTFDGIVSGNKMSGTFTPEKRAWTAVKL